MKQLFHTLTLCGSLLALASCTATDLVDEPGTASELGDVTVIATLEQTTGTRTGHTEADDPAQGVKVTWASGDAIGIQSNIDSSPTSTFTFAGMTKDGTSGIFSGKGKPAMADSYRIFYPATAQCTNGHIDFGMTGQTQWGDASMVHLGAYDVMLHNGAPDWADLTFVQDDHLNALMTFNLTNIPADLGTPQSITLGCTGDNLVFYDNTMKGDPNKVSKLKLKLSGFAVPTGSDAISIKAYLMFVPTSIPAQESLTITIDGDRGTYTFTSAQMTEQKDYSAGKRYTIAASTWEKQFFGVVYTGKEKAEKYTGKGTSADPYVIATAGQLRTLINQGWSEDEFFRLDTDIRIAMAPDVNNGYWKPIGFEGLTFGSTFDGAGHTISGSMKHKSDNIGFFGTLLGATIMNLTVDATVSGNSNVGGIAGLIFDSKQKINCIINCINKGTVTGGGFNVGGVIGCANYGYILGCGNEGAITGGGGSVGGITGYDIDVAIIGCYNTATVTSPQVGGIVGQFSKAKYGESPYRVSACYNTGRIDGSGAKRGIFIGDAFFNRPWIEHCHYVPDATNAELPLFTGEAATFNTNIKHDDLTSLNTNGVALLNAGIKEWNKNYASWKCLLHFVAGTTTTGPTLVVGAPE